MEPLDIQKFISLTPEPGNPAILRLVFMNSKGQKVTTWLSREVSPDDSAKVHQYYVDQGFGPDEITPEDERRFEEFLKDRHPGKEIEK